MSYLFEPILSLTSRLGAGRAGFLIATGLLAFFGASTLQAAPNFYARLDRQTIALGETAILSMILEDEVPINAPAIKLPNLPKAQLQFQQQQNRTTVINGRASHQVVYVFVVYPSETGTVTIPSFVLHYRNQQLTSNPLELRVQPRSENPVRTEPELAFLRLVLPKEQVYLGETFPVQILLYIQAHTEIRMPQLQAEGFILGQTSHSQRRERHDNILYEVFAFQIPATAAKAGLLSIGPAECNVIVNISRPLPRTTDLFSLLGPSVERRPLTLTTETKSINVLPLPARNQPPNYAGAVGNFSLVVNASPTNLIAGDPITLNVQIEGRGNLDAVQFPGGSAWPNFETYPPTSTTTLDGLGLSGLKEFEKIVIPKNASVTEIPPISFSYFDPEEERYRTITAPPVPLHVRPNNAQPRIVGQGLAITEPPDTVRDIAHIKYDLGSPGQFRPPLLERPWFLAAQTVPLLAWFAAVMWRRQKEKFANNPRLRRRLQVHRSIRQGIRELIALAEQHQPDPFFHKLFRLLQEQLGEKLDMPASAITEAVLDEQLRAHGAPDSVIDSLHELFQRCDQARFAPDAPKQELFSLIPKVESALNQLQHLPHPTPAK